jgi:hypothetical protein
MGEPLNEILPLLDELHDAVFGESNAFSVDEKQDSTHVVGEDSSDASTLILLLKREVAELKRRLAIATSTITSKNIELIKCRRQINNLLSPKLVDMPVVAKWL